MGNWNLNRNVLALCKFNWMELDQRVIDVYANLLLFNAEKKVKVQAKQGGKQNSWFYGMLINPREKLWTAKQIKFRLSAFFLEMTAAWFVKALFILWLFFSQEKNWFTGKRKQTRRQSRKDKKRTIPCVSNCIHHRSWLNSSYPLSGPNRLITSHLYKMHYSFNSFTVWINWRLNPLSTSLQSNSISVEDIALLCEQ